MWIDLHTHRPSEPGVFALRNDIGPEAAEAQGVYCSAGIHPWTLAENPQPDIMAFVTAAQHPRTLAIGECGIDRVHRPLVDEQTQAQLFLMHANIAATLRKPLILHCVRADDLIRQYRKHLFADAPPWFHHGFSGTPESAEQLARLGIHISVGPRLLESSKRELLRTYRDIGFFLETDDSDLPIEEVYQLAADILNLPVETLEDEIAGHFHKIFNL